MAKELLYAEIERNDGFHGRLDDGTLITAELTKRSDYRGSCVLMEFPTSGWYPWETLCELGCRSCGRYGGEGYCRCATCVHLSSTDKYVIHDIAAFWKGYIAWAIEIVHKHEPEWEDNCMKWGCFPYPVYIVKADNVLRRISDTPVFIERIAYRS